MTGQRQAKDIANELREIDSRLFDLHIKSSMNGDRRAADMYAQTSERVNRIAMDILDLCKYLDEGKHFDCYGIVYGLDEQTLQPLELNK